MEKLAPVHQEMSGLSVKTIRFCQFLHRIFFYRFA